MRSIIAHQLTVI